ncbi:TPA: 50S ribosomal protein L25 [Candidatus Saccharibacteria bacterium]|nr:MAG: hypothetical protein A3F05_01210 [Candidatus Saccharibacteria bacterium RIFCSPHIGHO2_12_FULL_47_17]HCM51740.1 50S ribosomal protein L25 [Candidatus Saccharibacteria bacterium]
MVNLDAVLELQERKVVRKKLAGLRSDRLVPAVIHNHGQPSVLVTGPEQQLTAIYHEAGKHHPLNLKVGSQDFLALIKDVHYHPVKRQIEHIVFQAIKRDEKVEAEVPIHLEGEIPAEKVGLMLLHQLDHVNVEALPSDLPDELKVDATVLAELGDKITVADLQVPAGVIVLEEAEHPIATVVETKAQISEEEEAAEAEAVEGEEGAEGETVEGEAGEAAAAEGGDKEGVSKENAKE